MNVVLYEPEIHWNAGNIGRTCVAAEAALHLVGPLGFRLDAREIRRAGLDYWPKLDLRRHRGWDEFLATVPSEELLFLFSTGASRPHWEAPFKRGSYLVFGSESSGLPEPVLRRFARRSYRIPMSGPTRSLNVSTAAGIGLYEALRRTEAENHG